MLGLIPPLVYTADSMTRADLSQGLIWDERFYVASLLSRARDLWRYAGGNSTFFAVQPTASEEQRFGIDAVLLIRVRDLYKAIGLEAKRPGFGKAQRWDKRLPKQNHSRFHRQLQHQALLQAKGWVTGGLFLNELPHYQAGTLQGDDLGSTFVSRHILWPQSNALMHAPRYHWQTADLQALLPLPATAPMNLSQLLRRVVNCRYGVPLRRDALISTSEYFRDQLAASLEPPAPDDQDTGPELFDREIPSDPSHQEMSEDASLLRSLCLNTGATKAVLLDAGNDLRGELPSRWRKKGLDWLTREQRVHFPVIEPSRL